MADKAKIKKIGSLVVPDGKYTDKDGNEKTKWHEIGVVFATPHHSRMAIRFHANGFGEGQFANIFYDKDCKPNFTDKEKIDIEIEGAEEVIPENEEIPF